AQVSLHVTYHVHIANAAAQNNTTVTVNAPDPKRRSSDLSASDSITYQDVTPTVSITKSHTGTINEGTAGQQIVYHFTVTNTSPATTDPITVINLSDTVLCHLLSAFQAANGNNHVIAYGAH